MYNTDNLEKIRRFQEEGKDTFPIKYNEKADVFYFDIDGERFYISANKLYVRRDKGFIDSRL